MADPKELIERAEAALEGVTEGPWTLNDRGLAPVDWGGASHLSDVAFAFVNTDHEDREACIRALVFSAASRSLVRELKEALKAALDRADAAEAMEGVTQRSLTEALEAAEGRIAELEDENRWLREGVKDAHRLLAKRGGAIFCGCDICRRREEATDGE